MVTRVNFRLVKPYEDERSITLGQGPDESRYEGAAIWPLSVGLPLAGWAVWLQMDIWLEGLPAGWARRLNRRH